MDKYDIEYFSKHRTCIGAALSTIRRTAEAAALRMILTEEMRGVPRTPLKRAGKAGYQEVYAMSRLRYIEPDEAKGLVKEIFQKLVMVPNVLCLMANSEPVLDTYANHHANLANYKLSARYRKMISLAVSQFNDCSYCIALHTAAAVDGGILTKEECIDARLMTSPDPRADSLLRFTKEVLERRGNVDEDTLFMIKSQGFDDQEIVEAIAVIAFITLANFTASVGKPELDFLEAPPLN